MAGPVAHKPHDPPSSGRLAHDTSRKGVFPLVWLLVFAALIGFGWSLYNRHASQVSPAPTLPASTSPTQSPPPPPPPPPEAP